MFSSLLVKFFDISYIPRHGLALVFVFEIDTRIHSLLGFATCSIESSASILVDKSVNTKMIS
jgi:hypothetical protein